MPTPKGGFKLMPTGTTKNEAIFNEDLIIFESLLYAGLISRAVTDPSTISPSPSDGDAYLVPDGSPNSTGDWAGQGGKVAVYYSGWRFIPPAEGLKLWVVDETQIIQYRSGAWADVTETPAQYLTDLSDVDLSGSPSPQHGDALIYDATAGLWRAGTGAGSQPTRTTATLSGSTTSVSIPAACTHFKFSTGTVTLSSGTATLNANLYNTGDTVAQVFSGLVSIITTAVAVGTITASANFCPSSNDGSSTSRSLKGEVHSPRDATKKTMASARTCNTGNALRIYEVYADAATDDDTIRFSVTAGTLSGSVEIEWYYN